jgi:hypothetical protein
LEEQRRRPCKTLDLYVEVKREAGYLLASDRTDETALRRVLARIRYGVGCGSGYLHFSSRSAFKLSIELSPEPTRLNSGENRRAKPGLFSLNCLSHYLSGEKRFVDFA